MRILGIDPGTARCGWGVIDIDSKKGTPIYVKHGCIESDKMTDTQERLVKVHRNICELIQEYKPDHISIELLFMFNNQKTVMKISEARGVILLACGQNGMTLKTFEYTPMQVKFAVTGYGRSDKKQVVEEVKNTFPEAVVSNSKKDGFDDAADALAVAMAHFHKYTEEGIKGPETESQKSVKSVASTSKRGISVSGNIKSKKVIKLKLKNQKSK